MSEQVKEAGSAINLRIPLELHQWLKQYAEQEKRSVTGQVTFALQAIRRSVAGEQSLETLATRLGIDGVGDK